jgi:hypothetical protein
LTRVFLVVIAFDMSVRFSAEGARSAERVVTEDTCRGIDMGGSVAAND